MADSTVLMHKETVLFSPLPTDRMFKYIRVFREDNQVQSPAQW